MADKEPFDGRTRPLIALQAGTTVANYEITERIGAGGMGKVYRARDPLLMRDVAIKFLDPNLSVQSQFKERFIREARCVARLNHPNIVTIFEIGEYENVPFYVMEYIGGTPLDVLLSEGPVPAATATRIAIEVCQGLHRVHEAGIVHRDLKPPNIILDEDDCARIVDFGVAKVYDETRLTRHGTMLGSIEYMSPEQVEGVDVDQRSDIFSIGAVLYQMVMGVSPFRRDTLVATLQAIVKEAPSPGDKGSRLTDRHLRSVIERALAKNPARRYQSAREFREELETSLEGDRGIGYTGALTPPSPVSTSLAVLYLKNLGAPEDEFLCYGITEDLIVDLTRLGTLRVETLRSVLAYKDSEPSLQRIADELDVAIILDGSLCRKGGLIRVTAQLVDVATGKNLWADRWEATPEDLPNIKEALAVEIIRALHLDVSAASSAQVGVPEASDPVAYEYYLRGKYVFDHKKDSTDVQVAAGLFEQALTQEPTLLAAKAGLAEVYIHRSEYDRAHSLLTDALEESRQRNFPAEEQSLLRLLADLNQKQSRWDEALAVGTQALEISRRLGDLAGEGQNLGILIAVHQWRSEYDEALELFERILEINEILGDEEKTAESLKNMGNVQFHKGDYSEARGLYERAIGIARRRENMHLEAKCLANIGLIQSHELKLDQALACYERARSVYNQVGDKPGEAICLNNIALVLSAKGAYRKAIESYNQAASIQKSLGNRAYYALALSNKARMKAVLCEFDAARQSLNEAIEIATELKYPFVLNVAYDCLGYTAACAREWKRALEHYEKALDIAVQAKLGRESALARCNIGQMLYLLSEYSEGLRYIQAAITQAREVGEEFILMRLRFLDAAFKARLEDPNVGLNEMRIAREDIEKFGDPRYILDSMVILSRELGRSERSEAERAEAKELLEAVLALARSKEVNCHIRWIEDILESS